MEPWTWTFSPTVDFRFPAGGDVMMDYQPWTNWGRVSAKAGVPEIEAEIFRDVALPGRQLGKLINAVGILVALARRADPDVFERLPKEERDAIKDLETLASHVDEKKKELRGKVKDEADKALDRLKRADKDEYKKLVDTLRKQ
jgi:hypothetical protein